MTATVLQVLDHKGHHVFTVREDMPVGQIADAMVRHHIGAVPVTNAAGRLIGLVSERTLVTALSAHGTNFGRLAARDIMMRDVPTATLDENIMEIGRRMTERRTRHLPVIDEGAIIGLVSIGDIVKARLEEAEHVTHELSAYIRDSDHTASGPRTNHRDAVAPADPHRARPARTPGYAR
ncbi:CBS domain-containing protein [Gluconacetobacter tumulisoli]|uniref:CBS domain-containing protein n=1 Tax=Gluconacetobacter tumulisoli TaxID=1286189 RepID=A0A7W4K5E0_9PROT|nr:CBS domain-containing protein [Gluconacetobacter tumulisoli]MBB2200537.1 CBS domain-containing protein [Gluconacetobacter tumulisoli]